MNMLVLLACSTAIPLAHVPQATRLAELANAELLVGTATGQLWTITTYGESQQIASLPGSVREAVASPDGQFTVRVEGHGVFSGSPWHDPVRISETGRLLVRDCEKTSWDTRSGDLERTTARTLGRQCGQVIQGTRDGFVDETRVSDAAIVRVQIVETGILWVDGDGASGCLGCERQPPPTGVRDAISLHLAPFVPDEFAWIDPEGTIWAGYE